MSKLTVLTYCCLLLEMEKNRKVLGLILSNLQLVAGDLGEQQQASAADLLLGASGCTGT